MARVLGNVGGNIGLPRESRFWSLAACIVATVVVGFTWGGWITGGTATTMATDAATAARTQLAAAVCISRLQAGPDASAQLVALKKTDSYERGDLNQKDGWATMPGVKLQWWELRMPALSNSWMQVHRRLKDNLVT